MELTEEQRERIRKNRERALEIQRKKRKQREEAEELKEKANKEEITNNKKQQKIENEMTGNTKEGKTPEEAKSQRETPVLEDFEIGASEFVTKKEAMSMYCLPEGTLAVCAFTEKDNPHHKGWKPMKLYDRNEIRTKAYKRWNGRQGLAEERRKRQMKKFEKEMKQVDSVFD